MAASFRAGMADQQQNGFAHWVWHLLRLAWRGLVLTSSNGLLAEHADSGVEGQRPNLCGYADESFSKRSDRADRSCRRSGDGSRAVHLVFQSQHEAALLAALVVRRAARVAGSIPAGCQLRGKPGDSSCRQAVHQQYTSSLLERVAGPRYQYDQLFDR